jgi:hypothetical protein
MLKNSLKLFLVTMLFVNWRATKEPSAIKFSVRDEVLYIKIFSQLKVQSFTFSPEVGIYSVWSNGVEILNTSTIALVKFTYSNDSIEVKTLENLNI